MVDIGVKPHLFADEDIANIFEYSVEYCMRSGFRVAPTKELLEDEFAFFFKRRQWPDEDDYILSVLVDKLKEKYRRAQATTLLREIAAQVQDDPNGAIQKAVNEFTRVQFETSDAQRLEVFSENYEARLDAYNDRVLADYRGGIPLGWPEVTEETFGISPGELAVFAGQPNVGKSWAACQIALRAAQAGHRVYFASLENTHDMTMWRLDCLCAAVPYKKYERGGLVDTEIARLREAQEQVREMGDRLVVDSPNTVDERSAFELYSRARYYGADLFVGDQLSWVTPRSYFQGDRTKQMAEVIQDIKSLTKESKMASVWSAQFNREAAKSSRGPQMHQIALTSQIEQICDWVFALSATEDQRADDAMVLRIIKARRSRLVGFLLDWELEMATRFTVREMLDV